MATIRDVAREAGVSIATVSRVMNKTDHAVNDGTRARVLEVVQRLDYHPSAVAKSLSMRRAHTIGIIIPDISNPYYAEIVRGVQDAADEAGYTAILQNTDRSLSKTVRGVSLFREKLADGVIFGGGLLPATQVSAALGPDPRGVVIGRQDVPLPAVRIDNVEACSDAVRHLASIGHKRIAFLAGARESNTMQDRYEGLLEGMNAHGVAIDESLLTWGTLRVEDGFQRASALLGLSDPPTAFVAGNDQVAIGAIRAAESVGRSVPGDVAVVGFDNTEMSAFLRPALTTIDIPRYQMGQTAMRLLLEAIAGKQIPAVTWLSTRLIVRESTVLPG